jgi:hypothetical protein
VTTVDNAGARLWILGGDVEESDGLSTFDLLTFFGQDIRNFLT